MKIIDDKKNILALIIGKNEVNSPKKFFTNSNENLQVGKFTLKKNDEIKRHIHNKFQRKVVKTSELIVVIDGKIKVEIFDNDKNFIESVVISEGMAIALLDGGHGIEVLEDSTFIEAKQGPYDEKRYKTHF